MKIFDTHCDTLTQINNRSLYKNTLHTDIFRMQKYENYAQFFAIFTSEEFYKNPKEIVFNIIDKLYMLLEKNSQHLKLCKNYCDLELAWQENKTGAFVSIEEASCITSPDDVNILYDKGIRMISLTWNYDNALGGGAYGENIGLTSLGRDVVARMNELGIICDVSHTSEKTFYDICQISSAPPIASHSNSYTLCPDKRNLTDEQFQTLIYKNGVAGINYYPPFLNKNRNCSVDDIVNHIMHFLMLGGENNICLGSDFDGVDCLPDGFYGVESVYKIFDVLTKRGVNKEIQEKIAYKNLLRTISICL